MARPVARIGFLVPLALASFAASVRAEAPCAPNIVLRPSHCGVDVVDARAIASALEVELGVQPPAASVVELRIEPQPCVARATRVALILEDAQGRSLQRFVDLTDLADSERARVLALAASELARATCTVQSPPPVGASPSPPAAPASVAPGVSVASTASSGSPPGGPSDPKRPSSSPPTFRFDLGASVETAVFAAYASALVGGRASVGAWWTSAPWLRGSVEGFALAGATRDALGDVSLQTYGGSFSLALCSEGNGARGELGPRLDVGGIRASGTPLDDTVSGSTAHALLVLPSMTGRVLLPLRAGLSMMLHTSVGHTLVGQRVHADVRTAAGIAGPYLGLGVGVAWKL